MKVGVRDATVEDVPLIAWVQLAAARSHCPLGFLDVAFPGPDAPRLALLEQIATTTGAPHFAHFGGFLVAELDGTPVGALSGYDPTLKTLAAYVIAMNEVLERNGWDEAHRRLLGKRLEPTTACTSDSPDDRWVVEWVALLPEARGRGLAPRLLDAILERGREAGFAKAQISYMIGNTPARLTYQRAGFAEVDEKRHPEFERIFGSPGVARMWRDL